MFKHILIASDGSELAAKAVSTGLALAKSLGATVTFVVVDSHVQIWCPKKASLVHPTSTKMQLRRLQKRSL